LVVEEAKANAEVAEEAEAAEVAEEAEAAEGLCSGAGARALAGR
jgi:hypothetical protein